MKIHPFFKKGTLGALLVTSLLACNINENKKENQQYTPPHSSITYLKEDANKDVIREAPWKNLEEYNSFVQSKVNEYYISDVTDLYNFYNINRSLPKYGFKSNEDPKLCLDCEGGLYKEDVDSIYFYSTCSEELFKDYLKYSQRIIKENPREELVNRLHHYIKHEAAHAFYYRLGKELGEEYLFNINRDNLPILDKIQYNLIEEGIADYMASKGKLPVYVEKLNDSYFKKMIEEKNDFYLYDLGFILVKPILDIDFKKGIEELIKNPLTKKDLNDLLGYKDRRIENLLKNLETK